jgi:hypothetical protein
LAGAVLLLLALTAFGAALMHLWRDAKGSALPFLGAKRSNLALET